MKTPKTKSPLSPKSQQQLLHHLDHLQQSLINSSISSIYDANNQYFPSKKYPHNQQMILVSKKKLLLLFEEIKIIKKAFKSQKNMFTSQLQSIKYGISSSNKQRILLQKQQQYLQDMKQSHSSPKQKFYRTTSLYFENPLNH